MRLPIVRAFLDEDREKMRVILGSTDSQSFSYKHLRSLCLIYSPQMSLPEKRDLLREALDEPPKDVELFICLLFVSSVHAINSNDLTEAQRLVELMKQLTREGVKKDLQVVVLRAESRIQRALDHYDGELVLIAKALDLSPSKSQGWASLKEARIRLALNNDCFSLAWDDLEDLRPYAEQAKAPFNEPFEFLHSLYFYRIGKPSIALKLLKRFEAFLGHGIKRRANRLRIECLIKLGRLEEARLELERSKVMLTKSSHSSSEDISSFLPFYENLCAFEALARKDFIIVQKCAQNMISSTSSLHPRFVQLAQQLIILADLATVNSRSARVNLQMLDPDEKKLRYAAEWSRLYLLEGNLERAALHFKRIVDQRIPELITDKLQFAYEVSTAQVANLILNIKSEKESTRPDSFVNRQRSTQELPELIGQSEGIRKVRTFIDKLASIKCAVLIYGEAGSGKKTVAKLIHQKSRCRGEPFITVHCSSTSDTVIGSELFGHVKGAFTDANRDRDGVFIEAGKGTVFLDGIHFLSQSLQSSILYVLENNKIRRIGSAKYQTTDARVIVGTNANLEKIFRKDLFFLLSSVEIRIPPLRERTEDLPLLVEHFLKKHYGHFKVAIGDDLLDAFKAYAWPGNITQLKNEIDRIVIAAGGSQVLRASMFHPDHQEKKSRSVPSASKSRKAIYDEGEIEFSNYTMERQRRLKELFNDREKLARADVVRLLGCSHGTATRDLKILENEGWIRRVNTSAHLRTSYFVRAG
jgi:DNA-binding NtrC family response regulator